MDGEYSPDHHNPHARESKRRRVEAIAVRYLQGKRPLILSAGLRGPFGNGWKNPWATQARESRTHTLAKDEKRGVGNAHRQKKPRKAITLQSKIHTTRASKMASPSPEVPRTAHNHLELDCEEDQYQDEVQVMPATAPSPNQHESSSIANLSRPSEDAFTQADPESTNPFWLHRDKPYKKDDKGGKPTDKPDASPTRTSIRGKGLRFDPKKALQLARPRPLHQTSSTSHESSLLGETNPRVPEAKDMTSRHNLIASPTPASSTGFVYRRLQKAKHQGRDAENSDVTSHSPSTARHSSVRDTEKFIMIEDATVQELELPEEKLPEKELEGPPTHSTNQEAMKATGSTLQQESTEPLSNNPRHLSQQSILSTQAAMLLAQVQFLDGSSSPISSQTHRPWSQFQRDTPQQSIPEPSPPITPVAFSRSQPDSPLPRNTGPRAPVMSTQDLLGAVSPFTFSTIKKKPRDPVRSSLRLSVHSENGDQSKTNGLAGKSLTPSTERVPLKVKNVSTSLWSFISEKASQNSLVDRSVASNHDMALSSFGSPTTMNDQSLDASLRITDQFFHPVDDT